MRTRLRIYTLKVENQVLEMADAQLGGGHPNGYKARKVMGLDRIFDNQERLNYTETSDISDTIYCDSNFKSPSLYEHYLKFSPWEVV